MQLTGCNAPCIAIIFFYFFIPSYLLYDSTRQTGTMLINY